MRGSNKESSRGKSQKPPVVGKRADVKVVEVELKSTGKGKKPPLAVTAKKAAVKAKLAARALKAARKDRAKPQAAPAAKPKLEEKTKPHKSVQDEAEQNLNQMIAVPTEKLLRPFRRAAEANRQQARKLNRARAQKGSFLAKPIKKGKRYLLDLRVHSPGTVGYFTNGGIEPGPALIRLSQVKGLHMIALTEYYDATYVDRVRAAVTPECGLIILPSVMLICEIAGCKEVPLLVIFPESATSENIFRLLDDLGVPKNCYGRKDYCLPLPFERILEAIETNGALAIPSRVDKTPYRQLAIPELVERYGMHAFDLAHPDSPDFFRDRWPGGGFTFFSFSSANALGQIGNRVGKVSLATLGFEGIREVVARRVPGAAPEAEAA